MEDERVDLNGGPIRDWSEWEINLVRRPEGHLAFIDPAKGRSPKRAQRLTEVWKSLDHLLTELEPRRQKERVSWSRASLADALVKFDAPGALKSADLWDVLTYLRAKTVATLPVGDDYRAWHTAFYSEANIFGALLRLSALTYPTLEDIRRVLSFKPIFDSMPIDLFRTMYGWEPITLPEGGEALHLPYALYHQAVWDWNHIVFSTPFYIDPYREVPGQRSGIPPPRFFQLGKRGRPSPERFFAGADLDEVRQYMTLCLRGEHMCSGNIASEFERGVVHAAFARLAELYPWSEVTRVGPNPLSRPTRSTPLG